MPSRLLLAALGLVGVASLWFVHSRGRTVGASVGAPRGTDAAGIATEQRSPRASDPADAGAPRRRLEPSGYELPADHSSSAALDRILALTGEPDFALDLTRPALDLQLLARLRDLVRDGDLSAAALIEACHAHPPGDERRALLILAASFASEHRPETDRYFTGLALGDLDGGHGAELERESLAAVRALVLAGRSVSLGEIAGSLIARSTLGEEQGFAGLTRLGASFALAALETTPPGADLESWLDASGHEPRVGAELWALALRSRPEDWTERAVDAALAGDRQAQAGLEALTGSVGREAVVGLATGHVAGADDWTRRSAWRALVAAEDSASFELVERELRTAGADRREWLAEALHTWRAPARPEVALVRAVVLVDALGPQADASQRVLDELDARFARWALDCDSEARARMAAAIESRPGAAALGSEVARRLAEWRAHAD